MVELSFPQPLNTLIVYKSGIDGRIDDIETNNDGWMEE